MKTAINLRIDPDSLARLDELARQNGLSRNELATKIIEDYVLHPPVVLGYFEVKNGELDHEDTCIECGYPLCGQVFASLNSNGRIYAPLCVNCATSK